MVGCVLSCVRLSVTSMDLGLPSSSIYGILQARKLERVAISFSRGSSQPRDQTQVSSKLSVTKSPCAKERERTKRTVSPKQIKACPACLTLLAMSPGRHTLIGTSLAAGCPSSEPLFLELWILSYNPLWFLFACLFLYEDLGK